MTARQPALALLLAALVLGGCGSSGSSSSGSSTPGSSTTSTTSTHTSTVLGYEGVPIERGSDLAPASSTGTGTTDGIQCGPTEQLVYHIHAHLAVYVNGAPRALPAGIGIPGSIAVATAQGPIAQGGSCIYWLHTHTADGVIHIESPTTRIYTLGEFFDEWHQPLSANQVGTATGKVTALVNGKPWNQSLRSIPLAPHAVIQLSVGSPVAPFRTVDWSQTQL